MKNKMLILAGALVVGAISTAQAIPDVSGEVDMSGTATLNSTLLGSAGSATALSAVTVGGTPTGAFTGTAGASVTWSAFGWNPVSLPATLWTFTSGGVTYTFDLSTISVHNQDNYNLGLLGTGTLSATGYNSESGDWSFTISNPTGGSHANFDFTFANSQVAVPDGGATAMMLGLALCGIGLMFVRKTRTA